MSTENNLDTSNKIKPQIIVGGGQARDFGSALLFALLSAIACLVVTTGIVDAIALTGPHDDWELSPMGWCHGISFAGWITCSIIGLFMPKHLLKNGCLSFAVAQLIIYQLLTMSISHTEIFCNGFAMPLVRNEPASAALLISCFLFSCRARYLNHKFTSAFDFGGFAALVIAFYALVSIFNHLLPFGDGFK